MHKVSQLQIQFSDPSRVKQHPVRSGKPLPPPPVRHAASARSRQRLSVLVVLNVRRLSGRQVLREAAKHLVVESSKMLSST